MRYDLKSGVLNKTIIQVSHFFTSLRNPVEAGLWQSQNNKKKERLLRRYHSSQRLAEGASAKLD